MCSLRYVHFILIVMQHSSNPVSQIFAVAKSKKFCKATADCNKKVKSFVFMLTQLYFGQWSSLPFCLPSLIVQWPTRIFHVQLLHMIVNLAYL